jgi:hypothetical protein
MPNIQKGKITVNIIKNNREIDFSVCLKAINIFMLLNIINYIFGFSF